MTDNGPLGSWSADGSCVPAGADPGQLDVASVPALAIVGRKNSGKTTLLVALVEELTARGLTVGTVKHHSHAGFDMDVEGKDSWRHMQAGSRYTVVASPDQLGCVRKLPSELPLADILAEMSANVRDAKGCPGLDLILVEGYRLSHLPTIDLFRSGNPRDMQRSLTEDGGQIIAVATDIERIISEAKVLELAYFALDDICGLADFIEDFLAGFPISERSATAAAADGAISVVLQAGGQSRRMGANKATVAFCGQPMICRGLKRLAPIADDLIITSNDLGSLDFLCSEISCEHDLRCIPDVLPQRGALSGIYTALVSATQPYVAIVACDMVFPSAPLLLAERDALMKTGADLAIPRTKHGFEPFHAVYRRETCLPLVKAALDSGEIRATCWFDQASVVEFSLDDVLKIDPRGGAFVNVNTPEELAALEYRILTGKMTKLSD